MRKQLLSLSIVISLALASYSAWALPAKAVNLKDAFTNAGFLGTAGNRAGFNTAERNVEPIIGNIISIILSFLGVIFLLLMIYGGYMWMTAMGSEEKVRKAQQLIVAAIIGLIVVVGAYAITIFVMARTSQNLLLKDETFMMPY